MFSQRLNSIKSDIFITFLGWSFKDNNKADCKTGKSLCDKFLIVFISYLQQHLHLFSYYVSCLIYMVLQKLLHMENEVAVNSDKKIQLYLKVPIPAW